ncbi:MAG: glycosyltransferase [Sulfitobacter sp.]
MISKISILVPVMNNQGTLTKLVDEVSAALDSHALEFIFVEDASTDGSRDILVELVDRDDRVHVMINTVNLGQQPSIRRGLARCSGDAVVVMDADLQDPPDAIPMLLEALIDGPYDAVFAGRLGQYQSVSRMISGTIFRFVMRRMTNLPKGAGGFVMMRGHVAGEVAAKKGKWFYLPGLIGCGGHRVHAIPVGRSKRISGHSAFSSSMRWKTGFSNVAAVLQERVFHAKR